jgi:ribonuclease P/MRP protein subunit RPP1
MGTSRAGQLNKYKRLTVIFSDAVQTRTLTATTNPALNAFDIIAVSPQDEKTFNLACTSLDIDIIVLPTTSKLPFLLRLPSVRSAISRGVHFEVSLGPAMRDADARSHFFANMSNLVRATRGHSILISGGGLNPTELRAPNDIANVCALCGLDFALAKAAISSAPLTIIKRGVARKASRGVIRVKDISPTGLAWEPPATPKKDKYGVEKMKM